MPCYNCSVFSCFCTRPIYLWKLVPAAGVGPGVWAPRPVVPAARDTGVSVPAAGAVGVFSLQPWGQERCVSQNRLLGGVKPGLCVSEGLRVGGWSGTASRSPGGLVRPAGAASVRVFPKPGVCACSLANFQLDLRGASGPGNTQVAGLCWYAQGDLQMWSAWETSVWVEMKPFLPLCACKLSIKWDSLLATVKMWGSRVCWDAYFICGAEHFCPPLLLPGFFLKPAAGSESSGVLWNVTVATWLQLLSQTKILNR